MLWEEEREEGKETERNIYLFFHLAVHSLVDSLCVLTRDGTRNCGVLGWHSSYLSYPARAPYFYFLCVLTMGSLFLYYSYTIFFGLIQFFITSFFMYHLLYYHLVFTLDLVISKCIIIAVYFRFIILWYSKNKKQFNSI